MTDLVLGPWAVGIDHVSSDTNLPKGAARDAVNGVFNREGEFVRRGGYALLMAASGIHSVWTSPDTGVSLCAQGSQLCSVTAGTGGSLVVTALDDTGSTSPMSFCDLNGAVIYANAGKIGAVRNGIAEPLAPVPPSAPQALATANGGLSAGRYGVAVTGFSGSESALSEIVFLDVLEGGGIRFTFADNVDRRIYRTAPNGDALYLAAEAPSALTSYLLGNGSLGRLTETQNLSPLPGGQIVRTWRGRTLVARGNVVLFSEPMRYGLFSPREGFVQFAHRVTLLEPVEGGIYVGTTAGVVFLQGSKPSEFTVKATSGQPPYEGSGITAPASVFGGDIGSSDTRVAAWLAPNGFVIGMASGQLVETQHARIEIPDSGATQARSFVHERRLTSIIQ
jgi:hypothetical protein